MSHVHRVRSLARVGLALAACGLWVAPLAAQAGRAEQGSFVVRIGRDTLAAERYTRTPLQLTGESMVRSPQTIVRSYTATFDASGNLVKYEVEARRPGTPPGAKPLQHAILTPVGDSVNVVIHTDSARTMTLAAPRGTLPLMNLGYGIYETAVMRAWKAGKDSVVVPMLFIGNQQTSPITIVRIGKDSVTIDTPFGLARARIDGEGRILGLASPGSTQQVSVERVKPINISALASAFANRGMGQLSPRDTARATIGGATLTVDYGRPMKRGRVIFGNVVPWGEVWRLGANSATTLTTDKDLVLGGTPVPAGTYTLFALPAPSGWKLIVSKKTGEWGTDYDAKEDLARIDMQTAKLSSPVEQFTTSIEPDGNGGVIKFAWDDAAASIPVQVKP